jgi:O-antigen/teichoic acid export membrane protein
MGRGSYRQILRSSTIVGGASIIQLGLGVLRMKAAAQVLGDVPKIASRAMGYVLLAANRGRWFLLTETMGWAVFLAATWLLMPRFGLEAAAIGYVLMYLVYLPVILIASGRTIGRSWNPGTFSHAPILAAAAAIVFAAVRYSPLSGMVLGFAAAVASGIAAAARLRRRTSRISS